MKYSREYSTWNSMRSRCGNPKHKQFHSYGGRGITVCDRWQKFDNFYADMGKRPSKKHSIDRINNDLGYFPENCRWSLPLVQQNNKCNTVFLEYKGIRKSLPQWARYVGMPVEWLRQRIRKGWPIERAIFKPVIKRKAK